MDLELLIPISFFAAVAYVVKTIVDARTRSKLIDANGAEDLMRAVIATDERRARETSLRWGIVLTFLAAGFAVIEAVGWDRVTPGAIAVLLAATGIGNLVCFALMRKAQP